MQIRRRLWLNIIACTALLYYNPMPAADTSRTDGLKPEQLNTQGLKIKYDNWIGIKAVQTEHGVQVWEVYPNSPASKTDLRRWDYVTSIQDRRVNTIVDFFAIIGSIPPETKTEIKYRRNAVEYMSSIEVSKRERLADMMGRTAPQFEVESYDNRRYQTIKFSTNKVKILYFFESLENLKDPVTDALLHSIGANAIKNEVETYGLTLPNCRSLESANPEQGKTNTEIYCDEIRLNANDAIPPFSIYYDTRGHGKRHYRIEKKPSIVVIDKHQIIRYAKHINEGSIMEVTEIIASILRQPNGHAPASKGH